MSYTPTIPPTDPGEIPGYLSRELQALAQSLQQSQPYAYLQTLNVAPVRPREGLIVKADGAHWNPGSGAGVYCYIAGAWVFFGGGGGGTGTVTHTGSLTAHAVILGNGTADVKAGPVLTDGQIVVGATGADPTGKTMSGDATLAASGALSFDLTKSHLWQNQQNVVPFALTSSASVTPDYTKSNDFSLLFVNTWLTPTINAPSGSPPSNADMCIYTTQPATGGPVVPAFDPASYVWGNGGQDAQPRASTVANATDTWAFKLRPDGKWHGTKIGQSGPSGAGYGGTSTTSLTVASSGTFTLTTQSGGAWLPGASRVRIASRSTGAIVEGPCSAYSGNTLSFAADYSSGSGTLTDWNVSLTGQVGTAGAQGIQGVPGSAGSGNGVNLQTGTTYTVQTTDASKLIVFNNASAVAVTVPQATGSFASPFKFSAANIGAGAVTLTPTTSTVDGVASHAIATSQGSDWSSDGTNWYTQPGVGGSSGGVVGTFTPTVIGTTTAGTATYSVQSGRYTKNGTAGSGGTVTVRIVISYTSHTGTGSMRVSGLPFAAAAGNNGTASSLIYADILSNTAAPTAVIIGGDSFIRCLNMPTTGGTLISMTGNTTVTNLVIVMTYEI